MKKSLMGASIFTLCGLYFLLSAITILIGILTDVPLLTILFINIIIILIQFLISPFLTDLSMKWFYKAKFDCEIPEYLKSFIEEVCTQNNMKFPRIGYIDDGAPNAFTYGHTKNDARVVITRGILELLSEDEVKAVVAHELGHAAHYDMLVMTAAQLVPLLLYAIYVSMKRVSENDNSSNNNVSSYASIISIIAYVLYLISDYVILWLSRSREYYADSFSLEVTKNPNSLASALVKVGYGLAVSDSKAKHSAASSNALGIFDSKSAKAMAITSGVDGGVSKENIKEAMKWEQWNIWAKWYEFNSTHPLISKRLLAISKRSHEFGQEPYIVFDLEKPESYLDDFLIELLINFLPFVTTIIGIIIIFMGLANEMIPTQKVGGLFLLIVSIGFLPKLIRKYTKKAPKNCTVRDLLSEVKVSHITSIPCTLEGTIIGRGNPGCIFNEDFVIKDETGIIFLDYNQPIHLINKLFALFKSQEYFDKKVKVTGWYRRSPVPFIEIKEYEVDGKVKRVYGYAWSIGSSILFIVVGLILLLI